MRLPEIMQTCLQVIAVVFHGQMHTLSEGTSAVSGRIQTESILGGLAAIAGNVISKGNRAKSILYIKF